jgi:hypothetical protein
MGFGVKITKNTGMKESTVKVSAEFASMVATSIVKHYLLGMADYWQDNDAQGMLLHIKIDGHPYVLKTYGTVTRENVDKHLEMLIAQRDYLQSTGENDG